MNYLKQINKFAKSAFKSQPAIYHLRITKSLSAQNVPRCIDKLREIRESKATRIFALSINVHAGSAVLAKTLRDALIQTAADLKAPLYTFAEDSALETGFYLLSAGHKIYANPYALLGDVASIERQIKIDKMVKKYVKVTLVKSGKYRNMSMNLEETSPETAETYKKLAEIHHKDMVDGIVQSRDLNFERKNIKSEEVRGDILNGRTFTAKEALEVGLIDGILTFEEFKDTYYKDYKVNEFTIDKDETLGYEQISSSVKNWWSFANEAREKADTLMESYSSQEVKSQIELAEDMMGLLQSENFRERLREYVTEDLFNEAYDNIQSRMSVPDIMAFLNGENSGKMSLGGQF